MGGKKKPRPQASLRTALLDIIGSHKLGPMMELRAIELLGVVDGFFLPETVVRRVKGRHIEPASPEVPDYSPEALKAMDEAKKILGGGRWS